MIRVATNRYAGRLPYYNDEVAAALDPEGCARARATIRAWPAYCETPLASLDGFARALGVARVWAKLESRRLPLESFKLLGAAYAVGELVGERVARLTGQTVDQGDLWSGRHRNIARAVHVTAATDGNHGRSLAWSAREIGCQCTIYLPANVSPGRQAAIEQFGATIVRIEGNYDQTVMAAKRDADREGRILIQDTSFPGYVEHCRRIMQGYTLMAEEIRAQLPPGELPTHVFLQIGCGGMAAAIAADFWQAWGDARPSFVMVESVNADSMLRSLEQGRPMIVEGDLDTVMIGISCGEVSMLAWDVLKHAADAAVAIEDGSAVRVMRDMAAGTHGDPPLVVGETGSAGLAALQAAMEAPDVAQALGLGPQSRVLAIMSEGAVDRDRYNQLIAAE
ncbi:MAG TPA: diaminopropionate ammonia-lyase [Azospirillaceae bacterium]|nr:diaminopropionate ammonia-lyase [Azospirillaceae bacterium]